MYFFYFKDKCICQIVAKTIAQSLSHESDEPMQHSTLKIFFSPPVFCKTAASARCGGVALLTRCACWSASELTRALRADVAGMMNIQKAFREDFVLFYGQFIFQDDHLLIIKYEWRMHTFFC